MKRRTRKEAVSRERYLTTDFGEALSKLEPLDLDVEFPSPTQAISIRLPREVLNRIRILADERDVPYQALIKTWLMEKLKDVA